MFRGIKTSVGINTAALKSIPNLKMWVNDESEELVDEVLFDTIDLSIRANDAKCKVWLILNQTDINHFIYRRFFQQNGVEDVWNGVKGDITYVHTTYLDNEYLSEEYRKLAEKCKEVDVDKYNNVWLGKWASLPEGRIYKGWKMIPDVDYPTDLPCWYGVDWGFSCFCGNTQILTNKGNKSINTIAVGDMVHTSDSISRVYDVIDNGRRKVITYEITLECGEKVVLTGTYNHLINVNGKWKKYGELTKGDSLFVALPLTGKITQDTQAGNTPIIIFQKRKKDCTVSFGNTTMGQSLMGGMFTTRIIIHLITTLTTLLPFLRASTKKLILLVNWVNGLRNTQMQEGLLNTQKKTGRREEELQWEGSKRSQKFVNNAGVNLSQQTFTKDSAANIAIINGSTYRQVTTRSELASGAEINLRGINTLNQKPVAANVHIGYQSITGLKILKQSFTRVYDLRIEGAHEYFANGILVHNCDPAAVVRACFDASTYTVYLHQVLYEKGLLTSSIAQAIKDDMRNRKRTLYHTGIIDITAENGAIMINGFGVDRLGSFDPKVLPKEVFDEVSRELNNIYTYVGEVYCDPARPEQIREMKIIHGLMASGAVNKDKTGRIEYLKYFNVCYTESSKDLHNEYVNYRWKQSKTDKTRYINEAEDGNDHQMDAINYGVATHLRRLGIANRIGEQ